MEYNEKLNLMLDGILLECPVCGMGVSRIATSERIDVICGWCEIKWTKKNEVITEQTWVRCKVVSTKVN